MKTLFGKIAAFSLLVLALAIPGVAQTAVTQVPVPCVNYTIYSYTPQGGAYSPALPAGNYTCLNGVFMAYGGAGAGTQVLGTNYTNATATASAVVTFPMLASTTYQFACTFYWQNSGTNASVFTLTTPTSPTSILAFGTIITSTSGAAVTTPLTGSPLAISGTAGAGATTYKATVDGTIINGANAGNLVFEGSATAGTVTILANSYCSNKSVP